jgi:hypothetical protein
MRANDLQQYRRIVGRRARLIVLVLYAYSKGVTKSRRIEQLCCENVIFMALAAHERVAKDFHCDAEAKTCICPAGEFLYQNGSHCNIGGREAVKFTGAQRVCGPCELRDQCLRYPERYPDNPRYYRKHAYGTSCGPILSG